MSDAYVNDVYVNNVRRRSLLSLVETRFTVRQVKTPTPWTVFRGSRTSP